MTFVEGKLKYKNVYGLEIIYIHLHWPVVEGDISKAFVCSVHPYQAIFPFLANGIISVKCRASVSTLRNFDFTENYKFNFV